MDKGRTTWHQLRELEVALTFSLQEKQDKKVFYRRGDEVFSLYDLLRKNREGNMMDREKTISVIKHKGWVEVKSMTLKKENHTGRNDRCPCGSGKKFKRCCLRKKFNS